MAPTWEQCARDLLWRLGVDDAQSYTAGDVVELANLLLKTTLLTQENERLKSAIRTLIIDANRLCDRQLGGTYEDDARRSIQAARIAISDWVC